MAFGLNECNGDLTTVGNWVHNSLTMKNTLLALIGLRTDRGPVSLPCHPEDRARCGPKDLWNRRQHCRKQSVEVLRPAKNAVLRMTTCRFFPHWG